MLDHGPDCGYDGLMTLIVLLAFLAVVCTGYWFKYLNLSHLKVHGHTVPPEFEGAVDPATLAKISDYTVENSQLGLIESLIDNMVLLAFLFWGLLGIYDGWITSLTGSFLGNGVLFFLFLMVAQTIMGIPFSLYRNFRIENKYGFNTMTVKLWITDMVKGLAIGAVISTLVVLGALWLVTVSPGLWWFWVWLFLLVVGIFMMYLSPTVIEPLFFKFEPLKVEGLEERIRTLMEKAGLKVSRVFQVDASRRDERESDRFAADLTGNAGAMASALVKLSKENLSNLHPHPLYAAFYYSHPPVVERIRALRGAGKQ